MTILQLTNRNLKVVADSWSQLRRSDIYRLLTSIPAKSFEEHAEAGKIIVENCPSFEDEVNDVLEEISEAERSGEWEYGN